MDYEFEYASPGPIASEFLRSEAFFRGIRGPVGSGTSSACCVEIFRRGSQQEAGPDGVRRTRWAIIRNTNPELRTTTIKTWLDWFPEHIFGRFQWSVPYTHHMRIHDMEIEVIFLALDRPEDVKKLLSLELTGIWINEAREVSKAIVDGATMRVGRYPSMRHGGPTWYGVIADTNAPEEDHWWPILEGSSPIPDYIPKEERLMLQRPENWDFFIQPAGMVEQLDGEGKTVTGYETNQDAENIQNLTPSYYKNQIAGKTKGWIDVYIMNRLGSIAEGRPVYASYNDEVHVAKEPLEAAENVVIEVGIDFGLTPSAVFGQRLPTGRWLILREIVTYDMGTARFAELLMAECAHYFPGHTFNFTGDPAGDFRAQTDETTPFEILRAKGVVARPASTNDPVMRIEAVDGILTRMVDGMPGMLLDPSCTVVRAGFRGGYRYKRMAVAGEARYQDKPDKNKYSHPHDAFQYMVLGAGEGRQVLGRNESAIPTVATRDYNVMDRKSVQRARGWGRLRHSG